MTTRWARFFRGWLTAGISVFVAAVSHVAGGGAIPGQLGVVLALAFSGFVCVPLAGKSLSRVRLGISVALSQFAFHLMFSLGSGSAGSAMVDSGAGHQHGGMVLEVAAGSASAPMAMQGDPTMWLAHAGAALVTMVILRRGEAAFWGLLELARTALVAVFIPRIVVTGTVPVDRVRVRSALADRPPLRNLRVIVTSRPHRGPPARALVFV